MNNKEKLQSIISQAQNELDLIETAELQDKYLKLVGKCFKYKNSYGNNVYWDYYIKVKGLSGYMLECYTFEVTSQNELRIDLNHMEYPSQFDREDDYIPITVYEFNEALNNLFDVVDILKKLMTSHCEQ